MSRKYTDHSFFLLIYNKVNEDGDCSSRTCCKAVSSLAVPGG